MSKASELKEIKHFSKFCYTFTISKPPTFEKGLGENFFGSTIPVPRWAERSIRTLQSTRKVN